MYNEIKERVIEILQNNGYFFESYDENEDLYFDSLQFMTTLIDIEEEFNIIIPEEYVYDNKLNTIKDYCNMIIQISCGID